ncbi:Headcase protein [Atta colombica]|uniref:Headcase protein n=1 Tax=Atta colombica TaxID=520822 RepID=A0A195AUS1_9HYME|nr:Headcase protein [Atta colombica]
MEAGIKKRVTKEGPGKQRMSGVSWRGGATFDFNVLTLNLIVINVHRKLQQIDRIIFSCRDINVIGFMEDEGNHGNDDTRCFILSTLAALQWSRVTCVLCRAAMLVFDRYPLVDGTFFLSPRQHSPACAEVKVEGRTQFLSAVCMSCLEGSGGQPVRCRFCTQPWDGSSLVLGTMYSYDIFAAMPCCSERLKLPETSDPPSSATELLLGLQPCLWLSTLQDGRRPLCETALGLLHPRAVSALQPVAVTIRELSEPPPYAHDRG